MMNVNKGLILKTGIEGALFIKKIPIFMKSKSLILIRFHGIC